MDLGLSTSVLGHHALPERLSLFAEYGSPWVEIHGYVLEEFDYADRALVEETAATIDRLGLRLWSCHSPAYRPLDVSALDDEQRSASLHVMRDSLEAAGRLGARVLVCDAVGRRPEDADERKARLPTFADSLARLLESGEQVNVRVVIENHSWPTALYGRPEEFLEIKERFHLDGLGACWDSGHGLIHGQQLETASELGDHLVTVHLHDNDGIRDQHLIPTDGGLLWPPGIDGLRRIGYRGPFMMELEAPSDRSEPGCRAHLRRAVDVYRHLVHGEPNPGGPETDDRR